MKRQGVLDDELDEGFEIVNPDNNIGDDEDAAIIPAGLENPEKVKEALVKFFDGLNYAIGGSIPKSKLFAEQRINMVVNMGNSGNGLVNAIDIGYNSIEKHNQKLEESGCSKDGLLDDVGLCMFVIKRLGKLNIPQGYVGGIFLIYLELCVGVKLL